MDLACFEALTPHNHACACTVVSWHLLCRARCFDNGRCFLPSHELASGHLCLLLRRSPRTTVQVHAWCTAYACCMQCLTCSFTFSLHTNLKRFWSVCYRTQIFFTHRLKNCMFACALSLTCPLLVGDYPRRHWSGACMAAFALSFSYTLGARVLPCGKGPFWDGGATFTSASICIYNVL